VAGRASLTPFWGVTTTNWFTAYTAQLEQ